MIAKTKHLNCESCDVRRQVPARLDRYTCRNCRPKMSPQASKNERAELFIAIVDIESLELLGIVRRWHKAAAAWQPGTHVGTAATRTDAVRMAVRRAIRTRKRFRALGKEYGPL